MTQSDIASGDGRSVGATLDRANVNDDERQRLEQRLRSTVRGDVRFDAQTRALYSADSSNYRQVPLGVVFPLDHDDVVSIVDACREFNAPILGRGAGTSLAGQGCNVAVVVDFTRHMNRMLSIDPVARTVRVQPGIVLDVLQEALNSHDLMFGPDPATHGWCTIGGMIGNNSCGTHALVAGKTVDNVASLRILTYDGWDAEVSSYDPDAYESELAKGGPFADALPRLRELGLQHGTQMYERYSELPRRVSGFNLDELSPEAGFNVARSLVGTESTCVLITEATLHLIERPRLRSLVVLAYPDIYVAADNVPSVLRSASLLGSRGSVTGLVGLEGFDRTLVSQMERAGLNPDSLPLLPPGDGWLLAELGAADVDSLQELTSEFLQSLDHSGDAKAFFDPADQRLVWGIRESGLGATAHPPNQHPNHEGWEDAAVPPDRLGEYLRAISALWQEFGYSGAWYGHFGQGCVHTRNNFDLASADGLRRYRAYVERAADICVQLGGSLSGEHGDGQARGELLERMFGPDTLEAFSAFKAIWDPTGRMNPGKIVDPFPLDSNLKHGPGLQQTRLQEHAYAFPDDHGSLQLGLERCVGVGRCRNTALGTMCPSYRATGDERDSTRGRARVLAEMMRGDVLEETWKSEEVFSALDLCLACKGCLSDCPTHVDMALYKSEFMYHYYEGKRRPRVDHALSLVPWALRAGSAWPALANLLIGENPVGRLSRRLGGLRTDRPAPTLAARPFRRHRGSKARTVSGAKTLGPVVVWPDTFTNAYSPGDLHDAIAILEDLGHSVVVPQEWACCGRTLYDSGRLDLARKELSRLVSILGPHVAGGAPVVVLEPSCLASFRVELPKLLAGDPKAAAVAANARSLSEQILATRKALGIRTKLDPRVVEQVGPLALHPHCHGRAIGLERSDRRLLRGLGLDVVVLDSGCCGLAGSFGFTPEHADISDSIANDQWLPRIRQGSEDRRLVLDGFSCQLQAGQKAPALAETSLRLTELLRIVVIGTNEEDRVR